LFALVTNFVDIFLFSETVAAPALALLFLSSSALFLFASDFALGFSTTVLGPNLFSAFNCFLYFSDSFLLIYWVPPFFLLFFLLSPV